MSYTVLGLFDKINDTACTMPDLEKLAIGHDDIKLLSGAPYPHGTVHEDHTPTPLWLFSLCSGTGGVILACLLAGGTQVLMNLIVGGKDPISLPVMGLLSYEMGLLGAVAGAVGGMLWMQGLPNWNELAYDPEITNGKIGLLVQCRDEAQAGKVEEVMKSCGASKIRHGRDDF